MEKFTKCEYFYEMPFGPVIVFSHESNKYLGFVDEFWNFQKVITFEKFQEFLNDSDTRVLIVYESDEKTISISFSRNMGTVRFTALKENEAIELIAKKTIEAYRSSRYFF